ncbi:radical SAM protein [Candidatus Sumerlaeota bacterium]|nr:radical SAM protein [Candidatus Sumerlaeota bacterium]
MNANDLVWIDEFMGKIKPYIFIREEDSLLILVPNQVYKLNQTGLKILKALVSGSSIREILKKIPDAPEIRKQIHEFFCDIRALVKGCPIEEEYRTGIEKIAFQAPINALPVLSEIAVTYRCNLDCGFCYAHGCSAEYREKDTDALNRIIDVIYREARVPSVSFTGGEPTLRKDLESLVERASSIGMWTNLITNGTLLTQERAHNLKKAGLRSAQVSLEGSRADVHDKITGRPGSFQKTLEGIDHLKNAGIRTHTNTTLNAWNVEDAMNDFVPFLHSLGMPRFSMNLMIPCGKAIRNLSDYRLRYSDIAPVIAAVKNASRRFGVKFLWYSPTPYCLFNPIAEGLGNKSCAACDGLLSVAPDGGILPCSSYNEPIGNILEAPFRESWNNKKALYFRERRYMPDECRGCEYEEICSGACPLYWKIEGCRELDSKRICETIVK